MKDLLLLLVIVAFMALGYFVICVFEKELFSHYRVEKTSFPVFEDEICIITEDKTDEEKMEAFAGFISRHENCTVVLLDGCSDDLPPRGMHGKRATFRCKGA